MISHRHRVVFIHIHKTGGSSIEAALDMEDHHCRGTGGAQHGPEKHWSARECLAKYGEDVMRDYRVFSVLRNPWDRIHAYWWSVAGRHGRPFLDWFNAEFPGCITAHKWAWPVSRWWDNADGWRFVDYVVSFESLELSFGWFCSRWAGIPPRSLPHVLCRRSHTRPHYTDSYDAASREMIAQAYAEEIHDRCYRFGGWGTILSKSQEPGANRE